MSTWKRTVVVLAGAAAAATAWLCRPSPAAGTDDDANCTNHSKQTPSEADMRAQFEAALWESVKRDRATQLAALLAALPDAAVKLRDAQDNSLLHLAALFGYARCVRLLLDVGAKVDARDSGGLTPLMLAANEGHADVVRLLLDRRASLRAVNRDEALKLSGIQLFVTGEQNALHFAASSGCLEVVEMLLASEEGERARQARDLDGHTPAQVALLKGHADVAAVLEPGVQAMTKEDISETQRRQYLAQRERARVREEAEKAAEVQRVRELYTPLHPAVYEMRAEWFDAHFLQALASKDFEPLVSELSPGLDVWSFPMLSPSFCELMLAELEHFTAKADELGIEIRRPNSMNRYGMVLDGFHDFVQALASRVFQEMSDVLFPEHENVFRSHHSFLIRYKLGEDVDLATHVDSSDVTVNVCLGKEFEGGTLYFHEHKNTERGAVDPYTTPHPEACEQCVVSMVHEPGQAVIHRGHLIHGADPLTGGERCNWIIWYRR